jgi:hypothetical protein
VAAATQDELLLFVTTRLHRNSIECVEPTLKLILPHLQLQSDQNCLLYLAMRHLFYAGIAHGLKLGNDDSFIVSLSQREQLQVIEAAAAGLGSLTLETEDELRTKKDMGGTVMIKKRRAVLRTTTAATAATATTAAAAATPLSRYALPATMRAAALSSAVAIASGATCSCDAAVLLKKCREEAKLYAAHQRILGQKQACEDLMEYLQGQGFSL